MTKIFCDRCGMEHPSSLSFQQSIPSVKVTINNMGYKREVDLCKACQKQVYGFIFGFDEMEDKNEI